MKLNMKKLLTLIVGLLVGTAMAAPIILNGNGAETRPIVKRYYNADHYDNGDGTISASIKGKWVNYMEKDDSWQPINEHFEDVGTHFEMSEAPFIAKVPKLSTGTATFNSNNRYDIWDKKKIKDEPLTMLTTAEGVNEVIGKIETGDLGWGETTYVVYEGAYNFGDLIFVVHKARGTRLTRLVRFNEAPSEDLQITFDLDFSDKIKIRNNGKTWNQKGDLKTNKVISMRSDNLTNTSKRGIGLRNFYMWSDYNNRTSIEVDIKKQGNDYTLTKNIPISYFNEETVYPVYTDDSTSFNPDANPETTCIDGSVLRYVATTGEDWADMRTKAGTDSQKATATTYFARVQAISVSDKWQRIERGIFLFDTSSIGAGYEVDSSDFKLTGIFKNNDYSGNVDLVTSNPASDTNIDTPDYDYQDFGTTILAPSISIATFDDAGLNTWALNESGIANIDMEDISKFGIRISHDTTNTEPTWSSNGIDYVYGNYADNGSNEPTLDVTYSEVSDSGNMFLMF